MNHRAGAARRIAVAALGAVAIAAILTFRQMFSHLMPVVWMVDFSVYYAGGRTALHGGSLYDLGVDTALFPDLPFTYPPFAALLFAPLSLLGKGFAEVLWTVLNVLCLGGLVWTSLGQMNVRPARRRLALTAVWTVGSIVLDPILLNLLIGQINIMIVLLVLIGLGRSGRAWWRGVALGVAAGIKLIPLIFIVYLLCVGRRGLAVRAGATFAATVALGFALLPADSIRYWLDGVFLDSGRTLHSVVVNHSLSGLFARTAGTDVAPVWTLPVIVAVGIAGLALAAGVHRRGQETAGILVVAFTSLLVSPITWPMHAVWIVPTLVWLTFAGWRRSGGTTAKAVAVLAALVFIVPVYERAQGADHHQNTVTGNLIATFGGSLFPAAVAVTTVPLWSHRLRPPEEPPADTGA